MEKIKKNLPVILLGVICVLLLLIVILLATGNTTFSFTNKSSSDSKETNQTKKEEKKKEENKESTKEENKQEDKKEEESKPVENNEPIVNTEEKSESSLLSYFESQEGLFKKDTNPDDRTISEKLKDGFISVVDFIFYDKEIKGYKFKELTASAKLKTVEIAMSIDHKIDSYFPDYKDKIKDKYNSFKGKLALKYLEVSTNICTNNPDLCIQAKEDFSNMKASFGFTFDLLKELATSGSAKIKDLYENWRDN